MAKERIPNYVWSVGGNDDPETSRAREAKRAAFDTYWRERESWDAWEERAGWIDTGFRFGDPIGASHSARQ